MPIQFGPNQTNPIRLYSGDGGGDDDREEANDDKKEDRIKYNTTQYTHDDVDDDNNKYVRGCTSIGAVLIALIG